MSGIFNAISNAASSLIESIRHPLVAFGRFCGRIVSAVSSIKKKIFGENSSGTSPSTSLNQRTASCASEHVILPGTTSSTSSEASTRAYPGSPDNSPSDIDSAVNDSFHDTQLSPLTNSLPGDDDQNASATGIDPQTEAEHYPENGLPEVAKPGSSSALSVIKSEPAAPITPAPSRTLDGANSLAQDRRSRAGGKGQFLTVMSEASLPVPPFQVIQHAMLQAIDSVVIKPQLLAHFHPDGIDVSQLEPVTLGSLKDNIPTMDRINQNKWLAALRKLLISDNFLQEVGRLPVTNEITRMYQELVLANPGQPVIIRSSGLKEDGFGDAQAGKYESCLHSGGDILKSCLEVLASSYQLTLCPDGKPQPMALIMQSYLDCRFGGVAHSHTSLQDDTLQIEYAPGQPRGAVAGTNSLKPHRYQIKRNGTNPIQWSPGGVPSYFVLKKTAEGFTEEKHEGPSAEQLPEGIPEQLKRHIVQLENLLGCPVDVEFAVDQKGQLFLVQVRPITALLGAASFSGTPPDQPLCAGEVVSEGLATGEAYYVDKLVDNPAAIPKGAIIHAVNADPWMLEPEMINRAGGYVFKNGGNNDHIAIMLKQSGKPCMRSDAPFTGEKPQSPSRVTLLAGNFGQTCAAYLLDGDQTAHWGTRYTKPTLDYAAALTTSAANKPCAPTFTRVEQGFLWLHAQNQRVLNYFLRGRLLDLCLAPSHNKLLSMSPQRTEVLQAMKVEVDNFLQDLEYLVVGFERFLNLHSPGEVSKEQDIEKVRSFLEGIQPLKERLITIKSQVQNLADKITEPMITHQELPEQPIDYQQWLNDGETLINELQQLNQPSVVKDIRSAHDLVFYIHKQFIDALAPVASLSAQSVVEKEGNLTISSFVSDQSESLLTEPIKNALKTEPIKNSFEIERPTVVLNLPTACIANIKLGVHACTVAMFEHGESGRGRKLQFTLSDKMESDKSGKLKRFWYLAHAMQLKLAGNNGQNMTVRINPATNSLTVELRHIESTEAMQEAFLSITKFLPALKNIDLPFSPVNITGRPEMWHWDYATVEKMITESEDDPRKNDFTFKLCLSLQGLSEICIKNAPHINTEYSMEHQIFFNAGKSFSDNIMNKDWATTKDLLSGIDQWFTEITAPLESDAERVKKELAFIMLATRDDFQDYLFTFVKQNYADEYADKDFMKNLCCHSVNLFKSIPFEFRDDKDFAMDVIMSHKDAFQHAGENAKNDKDIVIAMLKRFPYNIKHIKSPLIEDYDVVLTAASRYAHTLHYVGEPLSSNHKIITAAVMNAPNAFASVSYTIWNDKNFLLELVRKKPEVLNFLPREQQNIEIALAALKGDINMWDLIAPKIKKSREFLRRAKEYLPEGFSLDK